MKNFTFNGIVTRLVAIAVVFMVSFSCSKDDVIEEPKESEYNSLSTFAFRKSDNAGLTEDCTSYMGGSTYYVTVPEGTDITSLKPDFTISPKATIKINGNAITGAVPAIDFTEVVKVAVTSESGRERIIKVLVKPGRKELDHLVYELMSNHSIPGVSVAISKGEETVYESGLGLAIVEDNTRVAPDHLFRLASISKQFTTLCIMNLYEKDLLSVDDIVFGPGGILEEEFPSVKETDMAARVTIRHLLSHTSGWKSDPDPMFTSSFKGQSLNERIRYMLESDQVTPGSKYSYYNMGFGVLGKIVEKLSGEKFEKYMRDMLATIGVTDVHVGGDRSQRRSNEVVYYSQDGTNGYGNEMDVIAAAGGIIASPREMLKVLYHIDGLPEIKDFITPATRTLMLTAIPIYERYALGWRTGHRLFPGASYHTGNLAGTAVMWVMGRTWETGPKFNCVILCNSRSYISGFDDDIYYLMNNVLNKAQTMSW